MHRAARDVTGGIGLATTSAWDTMVEGHQRYLSSFDPRVPPSAFVSEADVQRRGAVMPIAERCLEDLAQGELEDLAQGELEDLAQGETPEGE